MSLKSVAAKIFAKRIYKKTQAWANSPIETQKEVFLAIDTICQRNAIWKRSSF